MRDQLGHHDRDGDAEQWYRNRQEPGHLQVLAQRHDDAADTHQWGADEHRGGQHDQGLDLQDVVGVPCDQRRRTETVEFAIREAADGLVKGASNVVAEAHRRFCRQIGRCDRRDDRRKRDQQHDPAGGHDESGVASGYTVVDDPSVERGED